VLGFSLRSVGRVSFLWLKFFDSAISASSFSFASWKLPVFVACSYAWLADVFASATFRPDCLFPYSVHHAPSLSGLRWIFPSGIVFA
jgi:hypothetical protein